MREIGQNLDYAKEKVKRLLNIPVLIKINSGRGKSSLVKGEITAVFPAVFSVKLDTGETKTFSYADVHTRGVLFLNPDKA
ncbi:MAG: hypothetical protein K2M36_03110 [Clostridia bacterium]|nr:hypothetical protein [Clostridia bacterium]